MWRHMPVWVALFTLAWVVPIDAYVPTAWGSATHCVRHGMIHVPTIEAAHAHGLWL